MYSFLSKFFSKTQINPFHLRKTNWLPASGRLEYCIVNNIFKYLSGIALGHMKCLSLLSADIIQDYRWHLDMHIRKTNAGQKILSFLEPKIWL